MSKAPISQQQKRKQRAQEFYIYGENACKVSLLSRFDDVVKAFFTADTAPRFADAMKALAATRKVYKIVEHDELDKITATTHHGGVALVMKKPDSISALDYISAMEEAEQDCVIALDGIANPHNLGAIMRSAAHFGVQGIMLADADLLYSGAAARVAEGGLESVYAISGRDVASMLGQFRQAGYTLITTSSHRGKNLYRSRLPAKVVIVMGEEQSGVSKKIAALGDLPIKIPGTGAVESLNVSVATALIVAEWWRQQG